ncbi:O-antigen ligase family protein [Aquimarina sp. M1]
MTLLRPEIDQLDSYYHKPYLSLIMLLALFFATKKLLEDKRHKILNFSLVVFFLFALVYPMSLPNIAIVFVYLICLAYLLYKKKKIVIAGLLLAFVTGLVTIVLQKSFKHKNLNLTEDIVFVLGVLQGKNEDRKESKYNPRKIIYTALLSKSNEVPLLGFGYCEGKKTVTNIVEERIYENDLNTLRNNLLTDTEDLQSYLWKKKGAFVEKQDSTFSIYSKPNNCLSHTLYQTVNDLQDNEFYTFSVSIKSDQSDVIVRLGKINTQMVVFDTNDKILSQVGKDVLSKEIKREEDGYYRISITTKVESSKSIALVGFAGDNNTYNHCSKNNHLYIKSPQLEIGSHQTRYNKGLSKNEKNLVDVKINAHNTFLQKYFTGGVVGLLAIILFYGWFLYLGIVNGNKMLSLYFLVVIFNSLFEHILYRQMGITIVIIVSILLIFKKKE